MEGKSASDKDARRIARLETLRRWMLFLAPFLLIGGYVADCLPVMYAAVLPLGIALLATYGIKWTEEKAGREDGKRDK